MRHSIQPNRKLLVLLALFVTVPFRAASAAPELKADTVPAGGSSIVEMPVRFDPGGRSITAAQFDIHLPKTVKGVSVVAGPAATAAGKQVASRKSGNRNSVIIFGMNQQPISSGVLLTLRLEIARKPAGKLRIPITNIIYSDPKGKTAVGATTAVGWINF